MLVMAKMRRTSLTCQQKTLPKQYKSIVTCTHVSTFIQDEKLDLCQREALSVSDMIYEATRCGDENIDAFPNSRLFRFFLFSAQQDAWHDPGERSAQPDESKICVNQMKKQK